jgi:phenylalanyl-tRNA synthetase alpha chain
MNASDDDTDTIGAAESLERLLDDVAGERAAALVKVESASDGTSLRALEAELLGKRSVLAGLKTRLGSLSSVDDRRVAGQSVNDALAAVGAALETRIRVVRADERAIELAAERLDLTEILQRPVRGHAHIVTQAWERLEDVFVGLGFQVAEGPEVETDWHNFEALNMPPSHPARGEFDTLFVDHGPPGTVLLRTHTSPVQIRVMLDQPPPIYMVMPGRVFRRDTPDATHMPVFHQIEGLVIDRGISMADLAGTIEAFTKAFFGGGFTSRLRPSYFPFTEPSAEFDIRTPAGDWLELGGCGMVHPNVLRAGGIDPEEWSGFAFGFGIDRMALQRHQVGDLRELYTNDIRFLEQF